MDTKSGAGQFDPSVGRDAEVQAIATSDLSVEELMAGGADVDTLIEAGVVDGGEEERTDYPEPVKSEDIAYTPGPPIPKEEFQAILAMFDKTW